ncbi:MAG: transcriptional regulator [Geobacteraceae bacterium GWC2_48_7]|nr:MAG: transcriptional regulator [Geobacteraceae bacterium GWC2_48_7]
MGEILSSKEIGRNLYQLRTKAGWTRERLAEEIGVTPQQIHKYESGTNMMNTDQLQQVAQALDVPVQSLFMEADESMPLGIAEKQLLDSYRAIPNKDIQESILKITQNATKQPE